jgi:hypothetical protein
LTDRESGKGFAGLSGMVSDGTVSAAEPAAPAKYSMISLTQNPSMAAPWSGDGPGEGWKWGDFYITVQTRPVTQSEFMAGKMGGKVEPWEGLEYLYSATVFRDPEKNEHGKSSRPVLVIAVEKSDFGTMVGVFDGDVRSNLGEYTGRLDVDSARATFFDFIGKRFALEGQPERLGTIEAIRPKVVTRDVSKIPENVGNAQGAGGGHPGRSPMGLFAGKRSLVLAGFAALVAWGILARPDFLFGYESYEECVIARMKGQPANVLATVQKACRKANPAVVNNQKPSNPFDQFAPPREALPPCEGLFDDVLGKKCRYVEKDLSVIPKVEQSGKFLTDEEFFRVKPQEKEKVEDANEAGRYRLSLEEYSKRKSRASVVCWQPRRPGDCEAGGRANTACWQDKVLDLDCRDAVLGGKK